jgi:hypothetical protein
VENTQRKSATQIVEVRHKGGTRGEQECSDRPRPVKTALKVSESGG